MNDLLKDGTDKRIFLCTFFFKYSGAPLLEPCLIVQPFLLFKIGWEWNGLTIHEVKLLGYWFRKP